MDSLPSSLEKRYCYNPILHWNLQVKEYFINAYGADHFARISEALTRPSHYSCIRVNILKSSTDTVIEKLTRHFQYETADCLNYSNIKMQVSENNAGDDCMRNERFDCMLSLWLEEKPKDENYPRETLKCPAIRKCWFPGLNHVLFVKGSGPHSIHYDNQPTQGVKEVVVSRKCAEAVLRGAQIFVPGLLACSLCVEKGDTVAVSMAVEQLRTDGRWAVNITRGAVLQGSHEDPQYLERNGMYIGQGITKLSRAGMFRASEGIAVEMNERVYKLPSFHNLLEGEIFLQNLPSIVAAHVLDPQQGERILDMCAAPGGKTTAIAILMRDIGEVVALDRSHNKVMDIKKLAAEMDLSCIHAFRLDALKSVALTTQSNDAATKNLPQKELFNPADQATPSKLNQDVVLCANMHTEKIDEKNREQCLSCNANGKNARKTEIRKPMRKMRNGPGKNQTICAKVENSIGFLPNSFDRVLLDAPCSALGLRPRLFAAEDTIESLQNHAKYQRKLFDQAVQLVRTGGVIVYSTCTINPGENEALVRYALDTYKFLTLAPQNPRVGGPGLVGKCELFKGKYAEAWLSKSEAELVQRFDPSAPLDTIGFFIAKFNVGLK